MVYIWLGGKRGLVHFVQGLVWGIVVRLVRRSKSSMFSLRFMKITSFILFCLSVLFFITGMFDLAILDLLMSITLFLFVMREVAQDRRG